jgi:transcriptional regulator with XRE-family HTH domain
VTNAVRSAASLTIGLLHSHMGRTDDVFKAADCYNGPMATDPRERLRELLVYLHEDLDVEMKGWLDLSSEEDKANLAHAILAIANHGGGFIVLGVTERQQGWSASPPPTGGRVYTQDLVNGVVKSYADPPFHCELHLVAHPDWDTDVPVIVVPGGHRVPIRSRRDGPNRVHVRENTYYIRGGGPESRPIRSGEEWNSLISRCVVASRDLLLDSFRRILDGGIATSSPMRQAEVVDLEGWVNTSVSRFESLIAEKLPDEQPSRFSHGTWFIGYSITGDSLPSLTDLRQILRESKGHETGWPPWWIPSKKEIAPYVFDKTIECWLAEPEANGDPSHSDFWRASPRGMMFLLRGYEEDGREPKIKAGTQLEFTLPIWRIGECLLHAERFGQRLVGDKSSANVRVMWRGLAGRVLSNWRPERFGFDERYLCKSDSISVSASVPVTEISSGLPEIVETLTRPLYEAFDFFRVPRATIEAELSYMRWRK